MINNHSFPKGIRHNQPATSAFLKIKELSFSKLVLFRMEFFFVCLNVFHMKKTFKIRSLQLHIVLQYQPASNRKLFKSLAGLIPGSILPKMTKL